MSRFRTRFAVFLLTLAVVSTAAPALADAGPGSVRNQAAAGWLARQMTGRSHFVIAFQGKTYPNQGGTIDAILAFAATRTADGYGARAIGWLERPGIRSGYIGDGKANSYAGATAKLALAAEVRGINPARFGGVNLIARLAKLLTPSGRYSDHSSFGDFSNAFSQSLAIIALSRDGGAPAKAVSFLLASECSNGGFPLEFGLKSCASEPDATAMDVQALLAAGRARAAQPALRWLARVQLRNGGFINAAAFPAANANSTGLAGEALAAGGWFRRAAHARKFLLGLQQGCSAPGGRRGAIAYTRAGFSWSNAVAATAQGILGLAGVSLARLSAAGSGHGDPRLGCLS
jgi:hypothetical protein